MTTSVALGSGLVLVSWLLIALLVMGAGIPFATVTARGLPRLALLRISLWWGVALITLVILALVTVQPLDSTMARTCLAVIVLSAAGSGVLILLRQPRHPRSVRPLTRATLTVLTSLGLMVVYLAFTTLGPATNYDTGLYHLGFIRYLADFGTVPGLANLFLPFGYANAQFPLAAAWTSGPWGEEGWRLLNGLMVVLVVIDLVLRMLQRRWTWGTFTLLVGVGAASLPLVAMADSLIASPTSDTTVLLLTLVAAAYLCDLLGDGHRAHRSPYASGAIGVMVITAGLTIAMRPTMLAYSVALAAVVVVVLWRRRRVLHLPTRAWAPIAGWLLLVSALQAYRDYRLSGWLLYPLSVFHWDVPWIARDPEPLREATLAAARDPYAQDGYVVAHSWTWIDDWVVRLPTQWEPWFIGVGLLVTGAIVIIARRRVGFPKHPRTLVLAVLPSIVAVTAWFLLSPPSFRFVWGPLFAVLIIVIGSALEALDRGGARITSALVAVGVAITAVTLYSAAFRSQADEYTAQRTLELGPLSISYGTAPVTTVPTREVTMVGGLVIQEPQEGDQCWAVYPLCTFSMGDRIGLLGEDIADGFVTLR